MGFLFIYIEKWQILCVLNPNYGLFFTLVNRIGSQLNMGKNYSSVQDRKIKINSGNVRSNIYFLYILHIYFHNLLIFLNFIFYIYYISILIIYLYFYFYLSLD
jgi:hypothetical protein